MIKGKLLTMLLGILFAIGLAGQAGADTYDIYAGPEPLSAQYSNILGQTNNSPQTGTLNIRPFDSTLGTLNSVTMYPQVVVSGALQAYAYNLIPARLTYSLSSTLAVTEMGNTVASVAGFELIDNYLDDFFGSYWSFNLSDSNATPITITSNFGRFAGNVLFPVDLTLAGLASMENPSSADVIFPLDGNAFLTITYDYTPVPLPGAVLLLGAGLGRLAMYRRRKMIAKN